MSELVERLRRVKYVRTRWVEPVGEMDEVVPADMAGEDGVEAIPLNPDGPEAEDKLFLEMVETEVKDTQQPIWYLTSAL
jgi:hypothetical protein